MYLILFVVLVFHSFIPLSFNLFITYSITRHMPGPGCEAGAVTAAGRMGCTG